MRRRLSLLGAAAVLPAGRAHAHAFQSGADSYAQFLEGAGVVLRYPETLLPVLALGILLSLWDREGMVRAWPAFLAGQLGGLALAAVVGAWIASVNLAAGLVVATLGALLPRHVRAEALAAGLIIGLLVIAASLEGHGFLELPLFIHLGILFAANLAVACTAGAARFAMEQIEAAWMHILWRVAASWLAAILALFLAFTLRGA